MGVNRAAKEFGMPRTTLKDRLSGTVQHGRKSGPKPYLSPDEEKELVIFVIDVCKMGQGKMKKIMLEVRFRWRKRRRVQVLNSANLMEKAGGLGLNKGTQT